MINKANLNNLFVCFYSLLSLICIVMCHSYMDNVLLFNLANETLNDSVQETKNTKKKFIFNKYHKKYTHTHLHNIPNHHSVPLIISRAFRIYAWKLSKESHKLTGHSPKFRKGPKYNDPWTNCLRVSKILSSNHRIYPYYPYKWSTYKPEGPLPPPPF